MQVVSPAEEVPMIDPGLGDEVVLITGCNNPHGIGAATAAAFATQGASVFPGDRRGCRGSGDVTRHG